MKLTKFLIENLNFKFHKTGIFQKLIISSQNFSNFYFQVC